MDWLRDPVFGNIVGVLGLAVGIIGLVLTRKTERTPRGAVTPTLPASPSSSKPNTPLPVTPPRGGTPSSESDEEWRTHFRPVVGFWFLPLLVLPIAGYLISQQVSSGATLFGQNVYGLSWLAAAVCAPVGAVIGFARAKGPLRAGKAIGMFLSLLGGSLVAGYAAIFIAALIASLIGASVGDAEEWEGIAALLGYAAASLQIISVLYSHL